jgi:hypothetical protein
VTQEPSRSGPDLIGDFQRWLVRSGARSMSREVSGQLRSALGRSSGPDVWEKATTADEAPECAWCPFCRAARALKDSGPGVSSQVTAATGAMAGLVHDTLGAFESMMAAARAAQPQPRTESAQEPSATVWGDVTAQEPGETVPDRGKTGQDPAKTAPDGGKTAHDRAKTPPDRAKTAHDRAKTPPDRGKTAHDRAKTPPDRAKTAPDPDEPESTGSPGGPPDEPDDRG